MFEKLPNFDVLLHLANHHPEEFERLRQARIDQLMTQASNESQRKLKGLQFQIDAQRQIHACPMASCMKISEMMYQAVGELSQCLNGALEPQPAYAEVADILDFPKA